MVGGKDKTRIRNATPPEFRDLLLAIARSATTPSNAKVSGAGTAYAGLPGYAGYNNGETK